MFGDLAVQCCGVDKARFAAELQLGTIDNKARTAWKYSASSKNYRRALLCAVSVSSFRV